jgi:hypothetical protein
MKRRLVAFAVLSAVVFAPAVAIAERLAGTGPLDPLAFYKQLSVPPSVLRNFLSAFTVLSNFVSGLSGFRDNMAAVLPAVEPEVSPSGQNQPLGDLSLSILLPSINPPVPAAGERALFRFRVDNSGTLATGFSWQLSGAGFEVSRPSSTTCSPLFLEIGDHCVISLPIVFDKPGDKSLELSVDSNSSSGLAEMRRSILFSVSVASSTINHSK